MSKQETTDAAATGTETGARETCETCAHFTRNIPGEPYGVCHALAVKRLAFTGGYCPDDYRPREEQTPCD